VLLWPNVKNVCLGHHSKVLGKLIIICYAFGHKESENMHEMTGQISCFIHSVIYISQMVVLNRFIRAFVSQGNVCYATAFLGGCAF